MKNDRRLPLEEVKQHGDVLFPFNIYPCTIPKDFSTVALHWHRNMEIIYIKKGGMMAQIAMRNERVAQGDICILPPGTLHGLRALDAEEAEYENIIFEPELLGSGAADICARQYLVPLTAGKLLRPMILHPGQRGYELAAAGLIQVERLCKRKLPGYELAVKGAMLQLMYYLMQMQPKLPAAEQPGTARLKQVLSYIQRNYSQPIRVQDAARIIGCSSSHFMRWFKQMTGFSFAAFLNEFRLAEAAKKLRSGEAKIVTIAQDVGFDSLSNFNRQFKIRYNATPREYRLGK